MPRPKKPKPITLTPSVVADDSALTMALDAFVRANPTYKRDTKKVVRRQRELRALLDAKQWHSYLAVEEATNERLADAMFLLVRWAFEEGRRTRKP